MPVLVTDLTNEEATKFLLTYDPVSSLAEADSERIQKLLETVTTDSRAIGELLQRVAGEKDLAVLRPSTEIIEDAIPAPPANPVARLGQLWHLGKHRLLCGDSTNPEQVGRLMGDDKARLFQTDPPYAVGYRGGSHPATRANRGKANRDKDWSKVYHEVGTTTFENEDGGGDTTGRSFYLAFYRIAVQCAIDASAAAGTAGMPANARRCSRKCLEGSWCFCPSTDHLVQKPARPDVFGVYGGLTSHDCLGGCPATNPQSVAQRRTAIHARYGKSRTRRSSVRITQRLSRTGCLRYRSKCIPSPATSAMNPSVAAGRRSSRPSSLTVAAMRWR